MTALSVLVVEDDAMIGMLLAEMLEDMGYTVCAVVATEEDAVADAARCKPGLMIVDEQLREGSGVSAMERIFDRPGSLCLHQRRARPSGQARCEHIAKAVSRAGSGPRDPLRGWQR